MNAEDIRQEAASQAIENTIQAVEEALDIQLPRRDTPTESRDIMTEFLRFLRGKETDNIQSLLERWRRQRFYQRLNS